MKTFLNFFAILFVLLFSMEADGQILHTRQAPLPCLDKTFTVAVHIVRDSLGNLNIDEATILESIDSLNKAFEPICVSFEACDFNIIENFQYDTLTQDEPDEMIVQYHQANRINIFYITQTDEEVVQCGFTELDAIQMVDPAGIFILKGCADQGFKALQHQMGRYFGLLRTFEEEGVELVNGDNCDTNGDLICDTPADPYRLSDPAEQYVDPMLGCRFINSRVDANGEFYEPDVGNYMSGYQPECLCGFTYDQYILMANNYLASDPRMW